MLSHFENVSVHWVFNNSAQNKNNKKKSWTVTQLTISWDTHQILLTSPVHSITAVIDRQCVTSLVWGPCSSVLWLRRMDSCVNITELLLQPSALTERLAARKLAATLRTVTSRQSPVCMIRFLWWETKTLCRCDQPPLTKMCSALITHHCGLEPFKVILESIFVCACRLTVRSIFQSEITCDIVRIRKSPRGKVSGVDTLKCILWTL